jgi:uncharacterized damage-inducible protein DinB
MLEQLGDAIGGFTNAVYTHTASAQTASIGMHIRHILEFYQALVKTVQASNSPDICYDNRQRNMLLETSQEQATQAIEAIQHALAGWSPDDCNLKLSVILAPAQPMMPISTTLHRELYHVLDHMVHHMALIKLIAEKQNIALAANFGLARATQVHQGTF